MTHHTKIILIAVVFLFPLFTAYSQVWSLPEGKDISLVDPTLPRAVDSTNSWQYRQGTEYDLNGDGQREKIIILANVERGSSGELAWDDGQPWEVRIEEPDGKRTRIFAQSVQSGTVKGYVTLRDGHPTIFLLEQTTSVLVGMEIVYFGPNKIKSRVLFSRNIDRFIKNGDGP